MQNAQLFLTFLKIGMLGFGGLGSVLALIEQEFVKRQKILTSDDITEALTYTKLLPGSTVVQVVSYLGWRLGGWTGSAISTIAFIAPAFVVMLVLAIIYGRISELPNMQAALRGLNASIVGLLLVTSYRLGRSAIKNWFGIVLAFAAFILAVVFHFPLAVIIVGAGILGILVYKLEK